MTLMRTVGFNRLQVERYFESFEILMQRFKFTLYKISNCDETGVTRVQKHAKVLVILDPQAACELTNSNLQGLLLLFLIEFREWILWLVELTLNGKWL